jgi:(2R)-sulfolactate sulfo-lyase subunit alpha
MDNNSNVELVAHAPIPLGRKIALLAREVGEGVIEDGQVIGCATEKWTPGDYVHTHNLKSKRW